MMKRRSAWNYVEKRVGKDCLTLILEFHKELLLAAGHRERFARVLEELLNPEEYGVIVFRNLLRR